MATTGIFNGTSLVLKVDTSGGGSPVLLGASTSCTVNFTLDTFETTNKDSAHRKSFLPAATGFTMDCEAFYTTDETVAPDNLMSALNSRTEVDVEFNEASATTGDYKYTGKAYITSCSLNAPNEDAATYSISLQGTGALTIAAN
jgi:TP901-1 family phage major tail protein|tara:strand:+ start:1449 stop:1880 length:432 start_codon:yes stop_codon:yes gene_type:complete